MPPTIRIDDEVYAWLQQQARPFEDTPNSVLRRIAKLDDQATARERRVEPGPGGRRGTKTAQGAFRVPILKILAELGGEADRTDVLERLGKAMARQLTPYDREEIASGSVRWQKSAEFEVHVMRAEKLLKPVAETARGVWALTKKGEDAARET